MRHVRGMKDHKRVDWCIDGLVHIDVLDGCG